MNSHDGGEETTREQDAASETDQRKTEITGHTSGDATTAVVSDPQASARKQTGRVNALQPGSVLKERFRLEKKLGAGAMGAVFRAVDERRVETQHHDPSVAVKVISGDFSKDSRAFIALQRETDKSQTLAHPNIITVYDFDRDGDIFFMTMESLTGATLDEHIRSGGDDRKQTLRYIGDMANAIAYAHRRNIVHSDLKPQNIFVTDESTLKVLDFGIARAFSAIEGDTVQSKDPAEIAGLTPTYASCEMFSGEEPHPGDDVYAIGLIAYEMLTGEHPFARKRAPDARDAGLKPKRIKGISRYQWQAIAKALEFRRSDRWKDADAFQRKFSGAGRRVRQLSAALLIAVVGFGGYMVFYQPEKGPDIPFSELSPATQQKFNAALAQGKQARKFGDINGALFYLDKAYTLHPRDPRAMKQINGLLDNILAKMDKGASAEKKKRQLRQIEELQKYQSLKQNPRLEARKKTLQQQMQ